MVGVAAVVALAVGGVVLTRDAGPSAPTQGTDTTQDAAPAIRLPDLRGGGRTVDLASFRGRPVIVNFFASWCAPCKRELPLLREAAAAAGDKVVFLGVAHLDEGDKALGLLRRHRITYASGNDPEGTVARRYRLRGLPSTVFVDRQGRIAGRIAGELRQGDLESWVRRLEAA